MSFCVFANLVLDGLRDVPYNLSFLVEGSCGIADIGFNAVHRFHKGHGVNRSRSVVSVLGCTSIVSADAGPKLHSARIDSNAGSRDVLSFSSGKY